MVNIVSQSRPPFPLSRSAAYTAEGRPSGPVLVGSGGSGTTSYIVQSSRGGRGDMLLPESTPSPSSFSFIGSSQQSAGSAAAAASRLQRRKSSSSSSRDQRRASDDQEVLDLSDFDLDLAHPDDDAASIRNVRTALTAAGATTARMTSVGGGGDSSSRRPSPMSPGNVSGWTHNEVASSNWGSSFGSSLGGGLGGSSGTYGFYGSGKKTK